MSLGQVLSGLMGRFGTAPGAPGGTVNLGGGGSITPFTPTQSLGGVLSGLLGRGAPGNPMMPGQNPNLAAPPYAGRFRMF
jgi:hypothetical protein